MSDAEWIEAEAAVKAFAQRGTLIRDETDREHFGNRLIEVAVGPASLRLIRDRGTVIVRIGGPDRWHAPGKLLAFVDGLSAAAALDRADPTAVDIIADWPRIAATVDDPELPAFEEAVTYAYMARVNAARRVHPVAAE